MYKRLLRAIAVCLPACLALGGCGAQAAQQRHTAATFAMSTMVTQEAYGPNAQSAMREVNAALARFEARLSLHSDDSEIARVNAAAGGAGAQVSPETADFLSRALALSAQSEGAFAVSIAPLSLAWGITGDAPRVVPQRELALLLPLVDDALVRVDGDRVTLPQAGMGLDLGGIAKGEACAVAREIYEGHGVQSAVLNIGGNVYVRGVKPDGSAFRVGFAAPAQGGDSAYIASFELTDAVMAVSGGYERFADIGGKRYIHIIDPRTGSPAESDIISVGVIRADGAEADFYSTTLFVWGVRRTLEFMRQGGTAVMLDDQNNLYVSQSLESHFTLNAEGYNVVFVPAAEAAA